MKLATWKIALLLMLSGAASLLAAPGTISTSLSPSGPLRTGNVVTVTFALSGYTDPTEIDGCNFRVAFSPVFSFVDGSLRLNDSSGPSQNWLRLPAQDGVGAGSILNDFTVTSPGPIDVSVADLRFTSTRGATANSGFLCAFDLQCVGEGFGSVIPSAGAGGPVLFDVDLLPAGVPAFAGISVTVGVRLSIALSGSKAVLSWPAPSTGYALECSLVLPGSTWTPVNGTVTVINGRNTVTVDRTAGNKFFRLAHP